MTQTAIPVGLTSVQIVKRMVFLAYQACGGAVGMGFLQEMRLGGKSAEEEQVWKCAYDSEDYPMNRRMLQGMKDEEVYCDYVFGRMMKWGCKWNDHNIIFSNRQFRPDYQGFCLTYPTDEALYEAAVASLQGDAL